MTTSHHIRPNTAYNILHAVDYAKYIGRPLNTFITINFDTQIGLERANHAFKKLRERCTCWMKDYCRRKNLPIAEPVWLFVFENPNNNIHVHWLMNVNEKIYAELERMVPKWMARYQNTRKLKNFHKDRVNPYFDKCIANYMIKGVRPDYIDYYHLDRKKACPQGPVYGQRARVSKSIGDVARIRAGFNASKQRDEWENLHPDIAHGYVKPTKWNKDEVVPTVTGAKSFGQFRVLGEDIGRGRQPSFKRAFGKGYPSQNCRTYFGKITKNIPCDEQLVSS